MKTASDANAWLRDIDRNGNITEVKHHFLHPRKWRTRAPVLTGGPGAAPGGVASKNGWVYMRVRGESISYSLDCMLLRVVKRQLFRGGVYIYK